MNKNAQWILMVALGCGLAATHGAAQTTNTGVAPVQNRVGQVIAPDKLTAPDYTSLDNVRPSRIDAPKLPPEVLTRIDRFKREAEAYLRRQEALRRLLLGANDADRAAIRDKMNEDRRRWLREARRFRMEAGDRSGELLNKMPVYREVIEGLNDTVRDQLRETLLEQQRTVRDRRGTD